MGASRFPGKPLATILGRPMIEHVYHRVAMSSSLEAVYVATCDELIRDAVLRFGGRVLMTSSAHESASDRVVEAATAVEADVVVMVQGDEPMTTPGMIDLALAPFRNAPDVTCVNLISRIETEADFLDTNTIKVVFDSRLEALYFSRSPIPSTKREGFGGIVAYKQVCIIPFRRDALVQFGAWPRGRLERMESIDMLRFLENGQRVKLVESSHPSQAVDTPHDLAKVELLMRDDPLVRSYPGAP